MWSHAWWTSWQLTLNRIIVRKEIVLKSYFSVLGYYTLICLSTLNINVSWMYRAVILLNLHNDNKAAGMFNMLFIYSFINSSINLLWSCYCYEFMSYLPYLLLWWILHGCQEAGTAYPSWTPVFSTSGTCSWFLVISYPSWTPVFTTCNCLFGGFLPFMDTCIHHM